MNDATRYFCIEGRENWRGVNQLAKAYRQWESDVKAICAVDPYIFEEYSYHPGPWRLDDSKARRRKREREIDDFLADEIPTNPSSVSKLLTVHEYASAFRLIPLGPKPYHDAGLWFVQAASLRKRALAGELGEFILYGKRILVSPTAVDADIAELKKNTERAGGGWISRDTYSAPEVWIPGDLHPVAPEPTPIKMQCRDCLHLWVAPGIYPWFCPNCLERNINEYGGLDSYHSEPECATGKAEYAYRCRYPAKVNGYCGHHKRMHELRALMDKGMTYSEAVEHAKKRRAQLKT